MKIRLGPYKWIIALIIVIVGVIIIALSPISNSFTQIQVEAIGAFIGVFAAFALAETMKDIDCSLKGRKIQSELYDDMHKMELGLKGDEPVNWGTSLWESVMRSGEMMYLDRITRHFILLLGHVSNISMKQLNSIGNSCSSGTIQVLEFSRKQKRMHLKPERYFMRVLI